MLGPDLPTCNPAQRVAVRFGNVENGSFIYTGIHYLDVNSNEESDMPDVTIVYWRDIPAQVIVGKGRRGAKKPLPERFEQAIDRAAMKVGAMDTDAYLAEWRKAAPYTLEGDPADIVEQEAARLDAEYTQDRIKELIANDGRA